MVDDFEIKYSNKKDAEHVIDALKAKYEVTQDWTGGLYCGIKLKCNYVMCILNISIIRYFKEEPHKFQHPTPSRNQKYLHQWSPPNYGETSHRMVKKPDEYSALSTEESNIFYQVVAKFLYYEHSVEPTMMVTLNIIAAEHYNIPGNG